MSQAPALTTLLPECGHNKAGCFKTPQPRWAAPLKLSVKTSPETASCQVFGPRSTHMYVSPKQNSSHIFSLNARLANCLCLLDCYCQLARAYSVSDFPITFPAEEIQPLRCTGPVHGTAVRRCKQAIPMHVQRPFLGA